MISLVVGPIRTFVQDSKLTPTAKGWIDLGLAAVSVVGEIERAAAMAPAGEKAGVALGLLMQATDRSLAQIPGLATLLPRQRRRFLRGLIEVTVAIERAAAGKSISAVGARNLGSGVGGIIEGVILLAVGGTRADAADETPVATLPSVPPVVSIQTLTADHAVRSAVLRALPRPGGER